MAHVSVMRDRPCAADVYQYVQAGCVVMGDLLVRVERSGEQALHAFLL